MFKLCLLLLGRKFSPVRQKNVLAQVRPGPMKRLTRSGRITAWALFVQSTNFVCLRGVRWTVHIKEDSYRSTT